MAEIWGAAIAAGGAILSGVAASKKAKQDAKNAKETAKEMTENDARFGAIASQFNAEQDYYYKQLDRVNKQRGLDQFREFSTVNQFAPEFAGGNNMITMPNKPDINALIDANKAPTSSSSSSSKSSSTGAKILASGDPVLGKILGIF